MNITPPPSVLPKDFYVYEHRKATTGEVFYVGKGKGKRAWMTSCRSSHWSHTAKKHGVIVDVIIAGLQEWASHEIEVSRIALHGRLDEGLGALVNKTDGGEGSSGSKPSAEARAKISAAGLGKKRTAETRSAISKALAKKPKSESHKAALSLLKKGSKAGPRSPEWRAAISAGQTGVKRGPMKQQFADEFRRKRGCRIIACAETGHRFFGCGEAARWLRTVTSARVWHSDIRKACEKSGAKYMGYTWHYAE